MKEVVLKIENVSKQYKIDAVSIGTLGEDLNRLWAKLQKKEDPYLRLGEINDRTVSSSSKFTWSLKDVSLEVHKGDFLGIVGPNGSGKSTLLKILSQITGPTNGTIKMKGKVSSLLEVGTGFHPDLTGIENIYLNGAILGMNKDEINKKLDEIISFSGVERYIHSPVKKYSSGMRVRLGFSVAAHLKSDILILDEVLAVGDLEFQKKCTEKMRELSREGRTILFVSHNFNMVKELCNRLLVLKHGHIVYDHHDVSKGLGLIS